MASQINDLLPLKTGRFSQIKCQNDLVPHEVLTSLVEGLLQAGAKIHILNNDILQEIKVILDISKVPLIPPDRFTLPLRGQLGHLHLNWKCLGVSLAVTRTLLVGLSSKRTLSKFFFPEVFISIVFKE